MMIELNRVDSWLKRGKKTLEELEIDTSVKLKLG